MTILSASYALSFSPMLPWIWVCVALTLAVGLVVWYYSNWRSKLLPGSWRWLVAAKAVSLSMTFLMVMNPSWHMTVPDDREFMVACLNDASGSMTVADCSSQTRLAVSKELLNQRSPVGKSLAQFRNCRYFLFSEGVPTRISPLVDYTVQPGRTDVDGAFGSLLDRIGSKRLGGILLISDGNDTVGEPMLSRAPAFAEMGIPINCIGVGDPQPGKDIAVTFVEPPAKVRKGKPFSLKVKVDARLPSSVAVSVGLFDGFRKVRERTITIGGTVTRSDLSFDLTSVLTGLKSYKVHVAPRVGEFNVFNNTDFVGVEILPPDLYKCLYFSCSPSWDYKYMKGLAARERKVEMSGLIRLAEKNWHRFGFDDGTPEGFPETAELNAFDCILLDLTNPDGMDNAAWTRLSEFVQIRGGGVIFFGLPSELPESFLPMLPYAVTKPMWTRVSHTPIDVGRASLLLGVGQESSTLLEDGLFVPEETPFLEMRRPQLKRAASVGATAATDLVLLAGHSVGAGKVAFVAVPDTWKWHMQTDTGGDRFAAFWTRLISWSTSGPKERLKVLPSSSNRPLEETLVLKANLLKTDFRPDNSAKVSATVTSPDGSVVVVDFFNSPGVDGQYIGRFRPRKPGLHKVRTVVDGADGERLERTMEYLFTERSGESAPNPMAEGALQNLARMTGGKYWRYDDLDGIDTLALSKRIRQIEKLFPLRNHWIFLLAVLLFLLPDWFLRRRTGLR